MKLNDESGKQELNMSRVFDAPPEEVFDAWVDSHQLSQWWGPKGFTNPVCELEVRPGGQIYIEMTDASGRVQPLSGVFQVISKHSQLVFTTSSFLGRDDNPGLHCLNTVLFQEDVDGKTRLTLKVILVRSSPIAAQAVKDMRQNWDESLDRLEKVLQ
jgi:uncharacterized protein YndB with AHSA1/START domain